jgi:hypothetical protein
VDSSFLSSDFDTIKTADGDEYKIQSELIRQNPFFKAAFSGGFKEAEEKTVKLEEDSETIARLIEYLYTGDYPIPEPIAKIDEDKGEESSQSSSLEANDVTRPEADLSNANNGWSIYLEQSTPTNPATENLKYIGVFLCHVKLYGAAKRLGFEALVKLCLTRFLNELKTFHSLAETHVSDVTELVDYVYSTEEFIKKDPIRVLTVRFVSENFADMRRSKEYNLLEDLIANGGCFARELLRLVDISTHSDDEKSSRLELSIDPKKSSKKGRKKNVLIR